MPLVHNTLRTTRTIFTHQELTAARSLLPSINYAIFESCRHSEIDPFSYSILRSCGPLTRITAFLLAYFKCRWSEIIQLSPSDFIHSETVQVFQRKTKKVKTLSCSHLSFALSMFSWDRNARFVVHNYQTVSHSISKAVTDANVRIPTGCHSSTHIFRHLYASWAIYKGLSRFTVSEALGHQRPETLNSYIHPINELSPTVIY